MAFNKAKAKVNDAIHRYCEKVILPNSYYVYRRLMNNGQVVEYEEYLQMVLDELKTPQEARS